MGKILELFESIKFFYDNKIKKVDLEIKKTVILLGDGFFARGFLHTINFSNYHVTQIYRDAFINPQDMMHSLQNKKDYDPTNYKHFRDIITNFKSRYSLTKIPAEIKSLDIDTTSVKINDLNFNFDYLVIGLGAQKSLKTWTEEINKITRINKYNTGRIAIVGLGPTGFELSMILSKNNLIDVFDTLSEDKILSYVKPYTKKYLQQLLNEQKINLHLNSIYDPKNHLHNEAIFCVGTKSNMLTSHLKVNEYLQLETNKNVYIGGDCANTSFIKTAQVAYQQGVYVADRLNKQINLQKNKFEFKSKGIALNLPNKNVLIESHPIIPDGIYPNFIIRLYSLFCI